MTKTKKTSQGAIMVKKSIILLIVLSGSFLGGCATNPVTGENQLMLISPAEELQIGKQYAPEVQKQLKGEIDNSAIQGYVSRVGEAIGRVSHDPELEFHFTAVGDESVNAMALPGGYIFITRGMLEKLSSEAELAAVLAHEIVHVTAKHSASAMSNQIGLEMVLSAVTSEKTSETAILAANIGTQLVQLRYSRSAEYEADIYGLEYMVKAGYDPDAMYDMMVMLENLNSQRPIEFFSTHPSPENRKEKIREKIDSMGVSGGLKTGQAEYRSNVKANL